MESKSCPFSICIQARAATLILIIPWDLDGSCVRGPSNSFCLSVIFKTDLGFFVSDAFQAADSEVVVASTDRGHLMLSGCFNSDAILV